MKTFSDFIVEQNILAESRASAIAKRIESKLRKRGIGYTMKKNIMDVAFLLSNDDKIVTDGNVIDIVKDGEIIDSFSSNMIDKALDAYETQYMTEEFDYLDEGLKDWISSLGAKAKEMKDNSMLWQKALEYGDKSAMEKIVKNYKSNSSVDKLKKHIKNVKANMSASQVRVTNTDDIEKNANTLMNMI